MFLGQSNLDKKGDRPSLWDWCWLIGSNCPKLPLKPSVTEAINPPPVGGGAAGGGCKLISFARWIIHEKDSTCCVKQICLYTYKCESGHYADEKGNTCEYTLQVDRKCDEPCSNAGNNPNYYECSLRTRKTGPALQP